MLQLGEKGLLTHISGGGGNTQTTSVRVSRLLFGSAFSGSSRFRRNSCVERSTSPASLLRSAAECVMCVENWAGLASLICADCC